ncbi:GntR family transcriptional regulator [Actinospica sp.]|uniref:GntR family transcriptional regulator n=1 Tax=Actinospica sp. TaxID=1872142 RepID=UPI002BAC0AAA|nr:GntR family transcriptional regulator [Actinospica sp.]HWG24376.1 GntR family transcriptional regulator [Actinospica sp.]
METLVKDLREPRYLKVKDHIVERIAQLRPGVSIPPERDLAVECSTSRTTVRKAVTELVAEGRLVRRQGSGTYVAEPKLAWPLMVSGFTEHAESEGLNAHTSFLGAQYLPATDELAERLNVRPGARILSMELLRSVNDAPMAVECVYVSAHRFPGLEAAVARTGSLYEALREKFGVSVAHAVETIETAPAAPREAALLGTDIGTPMLLVSQHSHTADGEPVEWVRTWYRGDRYSFVAHITRPQTPATSGAAFH